MRPRPAAGAGRGSGPAAGPQGGDHTSLLSGGSAVPARGPRSSSGPGLPRAPDPPRPRPRPRPGTFPQGPEGQTRPCCWGFLRNQLKACARASAARRFQDDSRGRMLTAPLPAGEPAPLSLLSPLRAQPRLSKLRPPQGRAAWHGPRWHRTCGVTGGDTATGKCGQRPNSSDSSSPERRGLKGILTSTKPAPRENVPRRGPFQGPGVH